jgi:hypothetical protein
LRTSLCSDLTNSRHCFCARAVRPGSGNDDRAIVPPCPLGPPPAAIQAAAKTQDRAHTVTIPTTRTPAVRILSQWGGPSLPPLARRVTSHTPKSCQSGQDPLVCGEECGLHRGEPPPCPTRWCYRSSDASAQLRRLSYWLRVQRSRGDGEVLLRPGESVFSWFFEARCWRRVAIGSQVLPVYSQAQ